MKRVVVTGIGALTPIGNTKEEYWAGLIAGKSGAAPISLFDCSQFKTRFACEVKGFNATDFMHRREAKRMDRFAQFAMVSADEAMTDSGLDVEKIDLDRCGVIWGAGIGGLKTLQDEVSYFALGDGRPKHNPFMIPKMIPDIAPGLISIKYGFRGMNYATVSACASASHAMINAVDYIKLGKADVIISGGSEAAVTMTGVGGFNSMKALSENNDNPSGASRPFDKDRDGFVLGEGGATIILEEYEHAKKRGAKIYAEVLGSGMTADAHHITAPHPEGIGAANVMKFALQDSGLNLEDVDYVNVHGTSTPLGDMAESQAILKVFGDKAYNLNISSTKSMTGHLLGAAGAVEAVACIFALQNNIVPPTINHATNDPEIDAKLNFTFNSAQEREVNVAISNTFGFGGHNTSIAFKKFID
ncbi:MAG: beta-ketoacyl-ACP synthase II [Saprospiraceae bacterium]